MPDMWMQDPLPFPNEQQGDSPPVHEPPPDDENDMMMPPPPQSQQPPTPMLKRGLSKLGGWFGGPKFPPPPPMGHPNGGFMMDGPSKKEQKRAKEYQKLGVFYCWRIADTQDNFESFSIPNQKIIKRKIEKGQRAHILLQKEKKLPGGIIIDLQTWRGCSMGVMNKQNIVEYLEIKEQDFNTMSDFRFSNPSY
jgi:hypothetical protein